MAKPTSSVTITPVDDPGNPHFTIKGLTHPIKDALLQGGAIWQSKLLYWVVEGAILPESVQEAISEAYGLFVFPQHPQAGKAPKERLGDRGALARAVMEEAGIELDKSDIQSGQVTTVYAAQDITRRAGEIVLVGTKGAVMGGGASGVGVQFEGSKDVVLCTWEQITTVEPEQKADEYKPQKGDLLVLRSRPDSKQHIVKLVYKNGLMELSYYADGKIGGLLWPNANPEMFLCVGHIDLDAHKAEEKQLKALPDLPKRQIEYLQALVLDKPLVKNAATRSALRRHHFISGYDYDMDDWGKSVITDEGTAWLVAKGLMPTLPEPDYTIETRYGVQPHEDWMQWITCHCCGAYLDKWSNRQPGNPNMKALIYLVGIGNVCRDCDSPYIAPATKPQQGQDVPETPKPTAKRKGTKKAVNTPLNDVVEPAKELAWERREITLKTRTSGDVTLEADVYGQVGIHHELVHRNEVDEGHLTLTHIASGRTVITGFYQMPALHQLAEQLAAVDIDQWWIDVGNAEAKKAAEGNDAIVSIIQAWGKKKPSPIGEIPETVDDEELLEVIEELAEAVAQ
jgi:hypothetical protein